jgi:hypothetical protein
VRRGWPGGGAEIGRGVIVSVFFPDLELCCAGGGGKEGK